MAEFTLTPKAARELEEIGDVTKARWGAAQADKYIAQINSRIALVANNPFLGKDRGDLRPGLRSIASGRHRIFYQQTPEGIEIWRILHDAQSVPLAFLRDRGQRRRQDRGRNVISISDAHHEITEKIYAAKIQAASQAEALEKSVLDAPGNVDRARAARKARTISDWLRSDRGPDFQLRLLREIGVLALHVPRDKNDTPLDRIMAIGKAAQGQLNKCQKQDLESALKKVLGRDLSL